MLTLEQLRALEQVTDTTWGQSSTNATPTMSVTFKMTTDDIGIVTYRTVVTYQGQLSHHEHMYEREVAEKAIKAYLTEVRKAYKSLTGTTIKLKLVGCDDSLTMIDVNAFSPLRTVRTAYYMCQGEVEVG